MGGKTGQATGLALLLAVGVAWAGGPPGGAGDRGLSPIITAQEITHGTIQIMKQLIDSSLCTIGEKNKPYPQYVDKALIPGFSPMGVVVGALDYLSIKIVGVPEYRLVQGPKFGEIRHWAVDNQSHSIPVELLVYVPNQRDFVGTDDVIYDVKVNGKAFRLRTTIKIVENGVGTECDDPALRRNFINASYSLQKNRM